MQTKQETEREKKIGINILKGFGLLLIVGTIIYNFPTVIIYNFSTVIIYSFLIMGSIIDSISPTIILLIFILYKMDNNGK